MAEQAERYKSQGNQALQAGQFAEAIELYSKAIGLEPSNSVYFSNRAAAYASLKRWREALDDSHEVVTLRPDWAKGWVRRGAAFTGMGQHEEARKAYLKATQLEPGNAQIEQYLRASEKAAAESKEKKWEDDLWSDDEEESKGESSKTAAAASSAKRAVPDSELAGMAPSAKRSRRKPSASVVAQLDRSLKDASEDSLRACLGQIAMADEDVAERVLHMLEGLNAASSAGEDDDDEEEASGAQSAADWLRGGSGNASSGGGKGGRRGRGRSGAGDDDSD